MATPPAQKPEPVPEKEKEEEEDTGAISLLFSFYMYDNYFVSFNSGLKLTFKKRDGIWRRYCSSMDTYFFIPLYIRD